MLARHYGSLPCAQAREWFQAFLVYYHQHTSSNYCHHRSTAVRSPNPSLARTYTHSYAPTETTPHTERSVSRGSGGRASRADLAGKVAENRHVSHFFRLFALSFIRATPHDRRVVVAVRVPSRLIRCTCFRSLQQMRVLIAISLLIAMCHVRSASSAVLEVTGDPGECAW